jgi:hypothetical protein
LKEPIQLNCNHFYCENCFNYLKLIQNVEKKPDLNQLKNIKIEGKDNNSINCLVCNKINEKNENKLNSNQLKSEIENYLIKKNKLEEIICDNETDNGEECLNFASIRREKCGGNFCEKCSKKNSQFKN